MFWCDRSGAGWHWEADELGEHRLFNRSGDMVARLNERGGKWVLTWPRIIPVQHADTEEAGKRLAVSSLESRNRKRSDLGSRFLLLRQ
jgi:hypothetical protein